MYQPPKMNQITLPQPEAADDAPGLSTTVRPNGQMIVGFAAFKNHLAYLPHSGSVFSALRDDLAGYTYTNGSLHFPIDKPLPKALVKKLIAVRLRQIKAR